MDAGQVAAHLLDKLHLLIQEVVFQEVTEARICVDRFFSKAKRASISLQGFTQLILRWHLHVLEEFVAPVIVLALDEMLGPLHYSSVSLPKWPVPSRLALFLTRGLT